MIPKKDSNLWFSYKQKRYRARKLHHSLGWIKHITPQNALFSWSDTAEYWDWNNCHFAIIGMDNGRARIVARRQKVLDRTDNLSGNKIWLMLGIKVTKVHEIQKEQYTKPTKHNPPDRDTSTKISRWAFHMDVQNSGDPDTHITDAVIWMESNDEKPPEELETIQKKILDKQGNAESSRIFDVKTDEHEEKIFPVIYQPRVDTHNNYIRSIFWKVKQDRIEISLVFNDEELSRAWFLDSIYRSFRRWKYGRTRDLETFSIVVQNQNPVALKFPGIYSNDDDLSADSTHGDKEGWFSKAPPRDIEYFYSDTKHPVIFINTSNHAMGETDNNPQFWKWEYVGWEKNTPLVSGKGSKNLVDEMLKEQAIRAKPCDLQ